MSVAKALMKINRLLAPRSNAISQLKIVTAIAGFGLVFANLAAMADSMPSRAVEAHAQNEKFVPRLLGGSAMPAVSISLGKLTTAEKSAFNAARSQSKYEQVGMGRALNKSQRKIALESLQWNTAPNGTRYTTLEFVTAEARAARLGISPTSIPKGVSVYVYGATDHSIYGPFSAADLRAANLAPGKPYWLPVVEGDTIRLELQTTAQVNLAGQTLDAPLLSHLTKSILGNPLKNFSDIGDSGSCNIDIACAPTDTATWVTRGNSVAKYYLTDSSGNSGSCTGTLLNSAGASPPAYFITANHCVNALAEATSMHFYWFFQRAACSLVNPTTLTETLGATYIHAVVANDATLVRLNTAPPVGAIYSGWNSAPITSGAPMVALHHPQGDLKKYSDGLNQGFAAYLNNTPNASASHIRMIWTRGTTEAGSSGSGLFNAAGELVGTLHGGDASCAALTSPDWYGRFDQAYPALQPWLTPDVGGPPPPQVPTTPASTELVSGTPVSSSVQIGEDIWYRIQSLSNTSSVTVTLTGLSADADIYVYKDTQSGAEACVSKKAGIENESCTVAVNGISTIYVDVYGYRAANYTVTAILNTSAAIGGGGGGGSFSAAFLGLLAILGALNVSALRRNRIVLRRL